MIERWKIAVISSCVVVALASWLSSALSLLPEAVGIDLALAAAAIGASFIAFSAATSLLKGVFGVDVLATAAVVVSIAVGEYLAAAVIAIMLGGGEILEDFASNRASNAIQKLIEASPKTAIVIRDGREIEVKIDDVKIGETVVVKPGGKIPVDGIVLNGQATVNQSSVTGESMPAEKSRNDKVYSGTIVQLGALEIETTAVEEQSTYGKIIQMVKEAEENRAPIERIADKYAKYFTPVVLALGIGVYVLTGDPLRLASVFVIACPCALVLATPTAIAASIGNSARKGILIRNGESLEKLSGVDTLVLDKTGTITRGRLQVVSIAGFNGHSESEIMRLAVTAEKLSEHPVAQAIVSKAKEMKIEAEEMKCFKVHPGLGVRVECEGDSIVVGNERMLKEYSVSLGSDGTSCLPKHAGVGTTIFVAKNYNVIGAVLLSDTLRDDAKDALNKAKINGVTKTVMLTGDNERIAKLVGEQIGVDEVQSDLMPSDKVDYVKKLRAQGHHVAMVGDGINDAPALASSDVGIAMGLRGTDVAIETAGIVLATDDLNRIPKLFKISRATMRIIKANIAIAMAVNVLGIAFSMYGLLPPLLASIVHESNALVGLFNSLRLLRVD
jgi:heavy metal translocating P-type ATPase